MAEESIEDKRARLYAAVDILLPYTMKRFPEMGNRTPGSIVDDIGPLKELEKLSKETIKVLQGIADTKLEPGETELRGDVFKMTITSQTRTALNQQTAKERLAELGELDNHMNITFVDTHRYSKI